MLSKRFLSKSNYFLPLLYENKIPTFLGVSRKDTYSSRENYRSEMKYNGYEICLILCSVFTPRFLYLLNWLVICLSERLKRRKGITAPEDMPRTQGQRVLYRYGAF
jgi:hypothetical protein